MRSTRGEKRWCRVWIVVLCAVLAVGGCGDDPESTTSPETRSGEAATEERADLPVVPSTPTRNGSPDASGGEADPAPESAPAARPLATVEALEGHTEHYRDRVGRRLEAGAVLLPDDFLVPQDEGASVSVRFASGARIRMSGEGSIALHESREDIVRVWLGRGTIDLVESHDDPIEVDTSYDVTLTVHGGSASVQLVPGESLTIERRASGTATVRTGSTTVELGDEPLIVPAPDHLRTGKCSGDVSVERDGEASPVHPDMRLEEGDTVVVTEAGVRVDLIYPEGSRMTLVGPGRLRVVRTGAQGRRVHLRFGTLAEIDVLAIALEVQTPVASLVLQAAQATAEIRTDGRVEFRDVDGLYAKVWSGGAFQDVTDGRWISD